MNNKIKIVTKHQEITKEELDRLMDFDALLMKYNRASRGGQWIKWTSIIVILTLVASVALYVNVQENDFERVVLEPAQQTAPPTPPAQKTLVPDTNDVKKNDLKKYEEAPTMPQPVERIGKKKKEEVSEVISDSLEIKKEEVKSEELKVAPVYIQAAPLNGYEHLYEYFNRELIFPPDAVKDSIQGILKVSFVIDRNGNINVANLQFINSLGKSFEEEAIRLIGKMPAWKPATLNGQPVPSKMTLPLTFKIQPPEKNKTINN